MKQPPSKYRQVAAQKRFVINCHNLYQKHYVILKQKADGSSITGPELVIAFYV